MDDDMRDLLRETAAMRLVLVNFLALSPRSDLQAISEAVNKDLSILDAAGGI